MNLSMHLVITQNVTNIASNNMEDYLKSEKIATKWGFAPFQYPPTSQMYECARRAKFKWQN